MSQFPSDWRSSSGGAYDLCLPILSQRIESSQQGHDGAILPDDTAFPTRTRLPITVRISPPSPTRSEAMILIKQQQSDTTQGDLSQGAADGRNAADTAKERRKPPRTGPNTKAAGAKPRQSGEADRAGPEDRPGSNPKNPGDFGHH
jgi:hypothetical protein